MVRCIHALWEPAVMQLLPLAVRGMLEMSEGEVNHIVGMHMELL